MQNLLFRPTMKLAGAQMKNPNCSVFGSHKHRRFSKLHLRFKIEYISPRSSMRVKR